MDKDEAFKIAVSLLQQTVFFDSSCEICFISIAETNNSFYFTPHARHFN